MNYLFRYLSTLKPAHVERLARLTASPREREVLDLLLSRHGTPEWTKAEAIVMLGMSGSMFDKTCSRLLRGILDERVGDDRVKLLEHLSDQSVHDLFLHELRRLEKECVAGGNREEMEWFYREAFRVLHLRFNSDYSPRLARRIARIYRRLDPSPDVAILIEASLLGMEVWIEASQRKGPVVRLALEKRLYRNDARITEKTGPIPRLRQLKSWIIYYGQLKRNPERRMECLSAASDLCERHPESVSREEMVHIRCQIAEEHYFYHTDLATPLRLYRELYELYPDVLASEEYHTFKFIQLCTINGDYEQAEQLLTEYFGASANLVVHGGGRSKDIALIWTKFLVMAGRLADARAHLEDAIVLNQKGFYLQYEVECRMLHTALCFLEGDFDTVERRLPAHIKYLRSKGVTYTTARYYPWFFKLAGAFIDERMAGKKLSPKLENKLEEFMEGAAAQYGVILRKMRGSRQR
ncbi:MAG: hypothetical protein JWQ98_2362 [Chlorobi bacterium]|nr:hypothetical protein [Chlorobiota bacterium]